MRARTSYLRSIWTHIDVGCGLRQFICTYAIFQFVAYIYSIYTKRLYRPNIYIYIAKAPHIYIPIVRWLRVNNINIVREYMRFVCRIVNSYNFVNSAYISFSIRRGMYLRIQFWGFFVCVGGIMRARDHHICIYTNLYLQRMFSV